MSDNWEFYPCQQGEDTALIFVNTSIGERLESIGRTGEVIAQFRLKHPREDGLTTEKEFVELNDLEDAIAAFCAHSEADMVGRMTAAGSPSRRGLHGRPGPGRCRFEGDRSAGELRVSGRGAR